MTTALRTRVLFALTGLLTAGSLLSTPGTASAEPCTASTPGMVADAYANDGLRIARTPPRYTYGKSPYIGARYNKCLRTLKVYFGGYSGITHYNMRTTGGAQWELKPLRNGVWSPKIGWYDPGIAFSVQACNRGGTFQRSSCTAWSPTVQFPS